MFGWLYLSFYDQLNFLYSSWNRFWRDHFLGLFEYIKDGRKVYLSVYTSLNLSNDGKQNYVGRDFKRNDTKFALCQKYASGGNLLGLVTNY